jgi:hypothetical protein
MQAADDRILEYFRKGWLIGPLDNLRNKVTTMKAFGAVTAKILENFMDSVKLLQNPEGYHRQSRYRDGVAQVPDGLFSGIRYT